MPLVSIIVPCRNEENTIRLLLDAIFQQTYPRKDMEVIIADGLSTDATRQVISDFQQEKPDLSVKVVDNPVRSIPAALNTAIHASSGEYILRLDAHCIPAQDYVARCITGLQEGLGENVGGVWKIQPSSQGWLARSIAAAAAHPLGVGDARYRYSTRAEAVDTVPFGAFRRSTLEKIGAYDESLLTNEDYELNARLRMSGGKVWLDPAIQAVYFSRGSIPALARQYFRYGFWKVRMLRRYPKTLRWRQAIPPLFILSLIVLLLLSPFLALARWGLLIEFLLYLLVLLGGAAISIQRKGDPALLAGIPLAIATMHIAWGAGFWVSLIKSLAHSRP
jgi:succinoglycan biosynthesis protein ExoA